MVTLAVVALLGLGVVGAITYYRKWTYLWTEWLTSVDHKKIGVMYIVVALVMLVRGFADAIMMRGQLALAIAAAKVAATRNGLDLCNRMFEVTGARSTHAALRLDRYWRNLRTQTLHDPLDYKIRELGDWALNQTPPQPTFYS